MPELCIPSKHIHSKILGVNSCYFATTVQGYEDLVLYTPHGDEFRLSANKLICPVKTPIKVENWLLLEVRTVETENGTLVEMSWKLDITPTFDSLDKN